jgi:hypothetical protein
MPKEVIVYGLTCPCKAQNCNGVLKNQITGMQLQYCLYPDLKEAQKACLAFNFTTGFFTEVRKYTLIIDSEK